MYTLDPRVFILIIALGVLITYIRSLFRFYIKGTSIRRIDVIFYYALILRVILLLICVFQSTKGMNFFVYDDETYYKYAMGIYNDADIYEVNGYHIFLRYAYELFGKSSLTGRLINIVFSSVSVYPLAYLETTICNGKRLTATKLLAYTPFMIVVSIYELKDIAMLLLLVLGYALIVKYSEEQNIKNILLIMVVALLSEPIRSGSGFILIGVFLTRIIPNSIRIPARDRIIFNILYLIFVAIGCLLILNSQLGEKYYLKFSNYQKWILTQFSSTSIYNWFVVTKITDIWKAPFSCMLYILQPLNALDGSGRVFAEYGLFLHIPEVPILVCTLFFIWRFIKKEKINSILLLAPYLMLSCINLTNAREAIYLYPILYLAFSYEMYTFSVEPGNSILTRIMHIKSNRVVLYMCALFAWSSVAILRILVSN